MKINRADLLWFLSNIRRRHEGKELTDEKLVDELSHYMEANPRCIDVNGVSKRGRFSYSTVGYGVFSLMGEKYRMGRIEVFDREDESGYQVHEGIYTMPFDAVTKFEDFSIFEIGILCFKYPIIIVLSLDCGTPKSLAFNIL